MAGTSLKTNDALTLKGSAQMIVDFFYYGINNILYQRGIYAEETFRREKYYGIPMMVTDKKELAEYIDIILKQIKEWLIAKTIQKMVLVITSLENFKDIERWQFDIECDKEASLDPSYSKNKPIKEIQQEIQSVFRNIIGSVTMLPLISEPCSFDVLVYTDKDEEVPLKWQESDPHIIPNSSELKLKSFSTVVNKVDSMVSYKTDIIEAQK